MWDNREGDVNFPFLLVALGTRLEFGLKELIGLPVLEFSNMLFDFFFAF